MQKLIFKQLGLQDYQKTWQAMKLLTNFRSQDSDDEIWFCEHPKVFTIGCRNTDNHIISKINSIPIIQTDRGGLITHHGEGQIMMYVMLNLKRYGLNIRDLVNLLESVVMDSLKEIDIKAYADKDRPGVFVKTKTNQEAKICSIGLRISKGKSYHGLCLNYDMDLSPFKLINPCGFKGMKIINIKDITDDKQVSKLKIINLLRVKMSQKIDKK